LTASILLASVASLLSLPLPLVAVSPGQGRREFDVEEKPTRNGAPSDPQQYEILRKEGTERPRLEPRG